MIVICIRCPDHDRRRIGHAVESFLTFPERLLRSFTLSDVAADRLKLANLAVFIEYSVIHPLLPSDLPVPVDDLMFVILGSWILAKGDDVVYCGFALTFREQEKITRADQFFTGFAEVSAICVIDEGQSRIREKAADEIGLFFHNRAITLLTLVQPFLHPFSFSDVLDVCQEVERFPAGIGDNRTIDKNPDWVTIFMEIPFLMGEGFDLASAQPLNLDPVRLDIF